jgi:hypothetical protein
LELCGRHDGSVRRLRRSLIGVCAD